MDSTTTRIQNVTCRTYCKVVRSSDKLIYKNALNVFHVCSRQVDFYVSFNFHGKAWVVFRSCKVIGMPMCFKVSNIASSLQSISFFLFRWNQVSAVDADTERFGPVYYSIIDGNSLRRFDIDNSTGRIYTNDVIDRENQSMYSLIVEARDSKFRICIRILWKNIYGLKSSQVR